jgi:hypothetical protein
MNAFLVTQQGQPQPGWALQYTVDLKPAGARTYEPNAIVTHTTQSNLELLMRFYHLTGDTKFLARVGEGIDWLESLTLPAGVAPAGRTHPTFIEIGTNKPLYVHREGSNVVNGRYFVDGNPTNTIGHYSAFRRIDVAGLRQKLAAAKGTSPADVAKTSPLSSAGGLRPLPSIFRAGVTGQGDPPAAIVAALNADGYWLAPLGTNSHPYHGPGTTTVAPGNFATTHVGDETDTSPFPDAAIKGISTDAYIRNMSALIRHLSSSASK